MTPEQWQRIKPLLQSALERNPAERSAFLATECGGDDALRQHVESLIASHEQAGEFIESPAFEVMAGSLADDQVVGRNLGPYAISARLGAGGMGEVYLAEDTRLGRKVALKMLPASLTTEDERVRRFRQEARAASALNHPNIITIYEIGEMDSRHFMATEFIAGETLFDRLKAGLMNISDALDVAVQVTSALCAAHQAGIVHRDIKPGNIMLRTDGIVKVLDFGLATLTEQKSDDLEAATLVKTKPGIVMGTAHYMSPEQARGQKMDARTDIFSLGVVLYEMLTGHLPFAGQTMTDVLASILMLEPPSLSQSAPEAPEELQRIVHSTLRKDREERYQTAGELLIDLKALKQELEFETRSRGYSSGSSGAGAAVAANARPETRYARSGDVKIAYQVVGDGPIDLVYVPGWVTNIDYSWEDPALARYYRSLASFTRLILFDKRGTGLSDQTAKLPTLEQRMDDVRAVMDAVGSERAALFGASEGGPMCVLFAATYPERTSALIAYGIFAKRIWDPEYPWAPRPEERQKWYDRIEQEWGGVIDLLTLAPSVANNERFKQWWASFLRLSASPGAALALSRTNTQIDVRHILPAIRVPTLVLHRTDDMEVNVEEGRFIAERIPNAKFVELPGVDHLPWVGDQNAITDKVEEFLRGVQHVPDLDSVLATVLFTHTLGPTAGAARLRPTQWRDLLGRHYQLIRRELEQFRGHEIETSENRLLATFDGPARAIRAACAVNDSARLLGIEIKAGLHTGECDVIGDKVGGLAVEIGAQVAAKATSGEILVSSTVKDLVAGSDIQFEDRGAHALKGVGGKWRLFAVKQETVSGPVNKPLPASQTKRRRNKALDSLAVLPLFNVSSDPNTEYLSDGITDSIINSLSQMPKLRVMARSTVFRYKHREIDPQEVGRDLKVRAVLMGRVQQLDDRLVISAELIDVTDGSQLWGEHYNRDLSDIFRVQEEIAKEISEKLRLKLTPADRRQLTKRSTQSTQAYRLYLKGRFFWNKRTEEGLRQSIDYFQQAIEKDPAYASAYAGLSDSYTLLVVREAISPEEGFAKAKAAAGMALEIDQNLSEAHASLGHALLHNWEWEAAEIELKRAIALNPGYPSAHHWYSEHLTAMARFDESVKELRLAAELDPLSLVINADLGRAFYFARQYDQTIKQENKTLEMDSHFWLSHINLGRSYTQKKMYAEAISELQIASELLPGNTEAVSYLGFAYAAAGNRDKALHTLRDLEEQAQQSHVPPYHFAIIHAGLNQNDQTLEWLERAYGGHAVDLFTLNVEPMFDQLRSDLRFTELVKRIGLAPFPGKLPTKSNAPVLLQSNYGASPGILGSLATATPVQSRRRSAKSKVIESLAVLPLMNASADPNMEYFSDGVTESIINTLSQLPKLRVIARSTVFRYKGREVDVQEVGQQLGVRAVLTGRVRQTGDGLMIAAELIDVTNDTQLWGEHYSRALSDIFVVQEEIAKEISEKLRLKLTGEEKKRLAKRHTENTEAYKLYLKGLYYWNKRTVECLKKGIEYFEQAIEMDPNYALAYAGLADSYVLLGRYEALSPKESFPRAKASAMKALQIDPALAEAFPSLASARFKYDWDWAGAERDFKHGIELNPNCATARHWYGHYLWCTGRFDEAVKQTQQALQLDPLSLMIDVSSTAPYLYARQYDQVIEKCRRVIDLHPNFPPAHTHLGWAYEQTGQLLEAIAEFQEACLLDDNPENLASLGHAYAKAGKIEEARGRIEKLQEISRKRYASAYGIALIHMGLGEKDQALRWLEKAYKERSYWLVHLKVDPRFDSLRADPRFTDLVQRIGLSTAEHHTTKELPGGPTNASIPLDQEIRFCTTSDGVRIAYATVGQGPPLLKAANWLNHLEFDWDSPIWKHLIREFARDHFLVRYDERGNGLSDWKVKNFTFEAFVQDLASVVDAVGMDRFPILGISQGGPVAIAYAVRYPERVSQLILYGCYARGWAKRGNPEVSERWEVQKSLIKLGWGQDNPAFRQLWSSLYIPDATLEQWQWFNDLHRVCTSPENAFRLLDELGKIDVVDLLKQVKVPTLVLHCRDDFVVPFEEGRRLAGLIPGARFVPLEGRNHLLLESEPAWPKFVTEVRRFLENEQFEAGSEWVPQNSPLADSIDGKTSGQHTTVPTASDQAPTGEIKPAAGTSSAGGIARVPVTSSAEYVIGGIKRHKAIVAAIAAMVVLLIAGLVYSYLTGRGRTIDSLAVLPFLNATGDPNTEYLSDGIAESIIYTTSKLPDLKVMPRSSVFRYKGREVDPQTVGRELGVSAVLTGRVIQRGDDLTISAELIDLRENRVLWGQHYIRKIGDILAVQEEIAREISEKLRLRLTTEDKKQLAKKYTENAEAYQLYLKGRYYWYKRTRDGYKKAIEHFDQAIQKDPSYALAYTGLADSYNVLSSYGIASPKESFPKGREAALRAREIDASLAEALTSLAYVKYQYDWDFSGAERGFKESIELNPNYATAHQWYALELAGMGRMDEAIREITRAQEIDPTSLIANVNAGWIFYHARQYDRAMEQMRKSLEMDPNFARGHWAISEPLVQKEQYDEAIAELQKARQLDETPIMLALLGHVYAVTGKRSEAQKIIGELTEQSKRMYVDPYFLAQIHTALGDRDKAFEDLEKAYQERSSWLVWVKVEPKLDSLHSDPRFTNLAQRIGLP